MSRHEAEQLADWVERFRELGPGDDLDYGYNHAIEDVVRELRTPTPGSELSPLHGLCVQCGGYRKAPNPDRPPVPPPSVCSHACHQAWLAEHPEARQYA